MQPLFSRLFAAVVLVPVLALAAPPSQAPAKKPSARPSKQYTISQFMETTDLEGASFSPDEKKLLFSSNESGIFNAYSVPVKGGKPSPLTRSKTDTTYAVSYFPHDERILYTRDQGGNENSHLYVRGLDGQEKDLTPGANVKALFFGWKEDDGSAFYVLSNERDARFFDLYKYGAKTYERALLYQNDGNYRVAGLSRDEKWIALGKDRTTSDSDIHLYDVVKKEHKHITPHQGTATHSVAEFDPGSTALYFLTDAGSEFSRVKRYVLATGQHEEVERANWDIMYTYFSRNGTYRVTAINEDGRTAIHLHDVKAGKQVALPRMPEGGISSVTFARSEKRMAFYHEGDRSPGNLYVYEFATGKATRLTDALTRQIDPMDLVDTQVVRFKSFDGLEIPNILYKPHQATPESKAPAIVWVHGGPGGQTRRRYAAMLQYLANHGYVVLGINNRGSSGYGKTFYTADDQKHGREPLRDCVEAKKYLASLPYVDGSRIGIAGGSYGGYMALAALAFHPDTFNVGVDIFGVSNWLRTLQGMPADWEAFREALYQEMGDPVKQEQMLKDISPLFHADKIQKPLLVIQGANDPRVIQAESGDIVAAVKKNNVPVEYVVFPDEGHGFTKKKNEVEAGSRMLHFLDQYLKKSSPSPVN
ncbi:S9 family peptidase [Stigmatella hybrida]|uniref:S9 family peptidase n=1 Tax=Stigmatella hybrida TaxID=394097 RepID=UPI001CDA6065|nr:S9 family peptidase [Stigmatella hybrida]